MSSGSYDGLDTKVRLEGDEQVIIFAADWHKDIVEILGKDALEELKRLGVDD